MDDCYLWPEEHLGAHSKADEAWWRWSLKRPDFREGKSIESKCNKTVVDHITQIPVEYHIHTMIISEYK